MQAIDRAAIDDAGIAGYTLMSRAAAAAQMHACAYFPSAKHWQVICGAGNNAGDGYVLARLAAAAGVKVSVIAVSPPVSLQGDAATAFSDFVAAGGRVQHWNGELDSEADLLIDAVFGSGLNRPLEQDFAAAVLAMNEHPAPVVALDLPSGLHGDSGEVLGIAVRAQLTVTFVGLKSGLFLGNGPRCSGRIEFTDLDIPASCRQGQALRLRRILPALTAMHLPPRAADAHKGQFGHVIVVGGGAGMPGAVLLAGQAALRCGAGRVTIATHPEHAASVAAARPELMCRGIATAEDLAPLLESGSMCVLGPGLGRDPWSREIFERVVGSDLPMVVDADALFWLAKAPARSDHWILTPHPGEAARLLGKNNPAIQRDRLSAVQELQQRYGGTVVLKGAGTLICSGDDVARICTNGNAGMASPGMGDVLAGVIGSLAAQGLEHEMAASIGADLHARAGDLAASQGQRGLLASDLLPALRTLVNP